MKVSRKLGIATIVCVALSGAAWATPGNGNGGGNGNSDRFNVINLPQITTPLIHRSGSQQLAPIVNHKMPSNSLTDGNRGIGLKGHDFKEQGRDADRRFDNLDRKQAVTKIDDKSERAEKKEVETRLAANTADDASSSRKTAVNQPQVACR